VDGRDKPGHDPAYTIGINDGGASFLPREERFECHLEVDAFGAKLVIDRGYLAQ